MPAGAPSTTTRSDPSTTDSDATGAPRDSGCVASGRDQSAATASSTSRRAALLAGLIPATMPAPAPTNRTTRSGVTGRAKVAKTSPAAIASTRHHHAKDPRPRTYNRTSAVEGKRKEDSDV